MAKLTLDIVDEYPYEIIGISASAKDYRICWSLNQTLEIALKREPSLKVFTKKSEPVEHGYYTFLDEDTDIKFRLVENKRSASKFLPEAPKADYLFIIDESPGIEPDSILSKIREIRPVLMAFRIDSDQLKNKQNLLLTA
jgi:hypothetical protein